MHIGLKQNLPRSTALDIITRLLANVAFVCVHVVGRFSEDFSEVRGWEVEGFSFRLNGWQQYYARNYEKKCNRLVTASPDCLRPLLSWKKLPNKLCSWLKSFFDIRRSIHKIVKSCVRTNYLTFSLYFSFHYRAGKCELYVGSACSEVLRGRYVFVKSWLRQRSLESRISSWLTTGIYFFTIIRFYNLLH